MYFRQAGGALKTGNLPLAARIGTGTSGKILSPPSVNSHLCIEKDKRSLDRLRRARVSSVLFRLSFDALKLGGIFFGRAHMKFTTQAQSPAIASASVNSALRLFVSATKYLPRIQARRNVLSLLLVSLFINSFAALVSAAFCPPARANYFDEPIAEPSMAPSVDVDEAPDDNITFPVPEPAHIMRACEAFGDNYFYIPGTNTCLRISGYAQANGMTGDQLYTRQIGGLHRHSTAAQVETAIRFHTATETDWGTLRSFAEMHVDWQGGGENGDANETRNSLHFGYIELGGIRVGIDESIFAYWTGYYGNIMNDSILDPSNIRTNSISYTFNSGNGFSYIFGVEQGNNFNGDGNLDNQYDEYNIVAPYTFHGGWRFRRDGSMFYKTLAEQSHNYTPFMATGVKWEQNWGTYSTVLGYDSYDAEWAAKTRLDVNLTKRWSLFTMWGYKTMRDYYNIDTTYGDNGQKQVGTRADGSPIYRFGIYRQVGSMYGDWGGHWAGWFGGTYKFNPMTSFNFQHAYSSDHSYAVSANISHEMSGGLILIAELSYMTWGDNYGRTLANGDHYGTTLKGRNAVQEKLQLQRYF